jgi:putative membrane protein
VKSLLRNTLINSLSLFILAQIESGLTIHGGLLTFIAGGLALSLLFLIVKPILNLISLPFNLITLGLFSFLINAIIFYLLTVFVTSISITSFTFQGYSFLGFIAPRMYINTFFAFIIIALLQSLIVTFLSWLIKK